MSFAGTFHIGGDIHPNAVSRFYSNVRCLQEDIGKDLPLGALRWDSRRLPLNEASVDVIVSDLVRFMILIQTNVSYLVFIFRTVLTFGIFLSITALWSSPGEQDWKSQLV